MRSLQYLWPAAAAVHGLDISPRSVSDAKPELFGRASTSEPCGQVAETWAAQNNMGRSTFVTFAEVALQCLQSVPVDKAGDLELLKEINDFVQFQTTLAYLKEGNDNNAAVDILGGLTEIASNITQDLFSSEYDVQLSITNLIRSAHDFHFYWSSDIDSIFNFHRPAADLVSLAADFDSLPKVYFQSDVGTANAGNFTPSAIKTINGQAPEDYVTAFANLEQYHDADARYNQLFLNPNAYSTSTQNVGSFGTPSIYPGVNTTFVFENGTSRNIQNSATISGDWSTVTDGDSFFKTFCMGATSANSNSESSALKKRAEAFYPPNNYPAPIIVQSGLAAQGYYLNGSYSDVAVLAMPTFDPVIRGNSEFSDGALEFQTVVRAFLKDAVAKNKKKLVLDIRGNGGGKIVLGYDLFKQLFPSMTPYGGTRLHMNEGNQVLSKLIGDLAGNDTLKSNDPELWNTINDWYGDQIWENIYDNEGKPFANYEDYAGPQTFNGDNFTDIRRYNFNDDNGYAGTINVTGYRSLSTVGSQPFAAENIVIITDGSCGSTCAIFSELMREQGKVNSIAIGGRPKKAPMQGVGGSKGAQVFQWGSVAQNMIKGLNWTYIVEGQEVFESANETAVGTIANRPGLATTRSSHWDADQTLQGAVNSLNNYRNDSETTPLEFIYEAADCRLFNTLASNKDVTKLWQAAVDVKWGNAQCVEGSTSDPSSLTASSGVPFNAQVDNSTGSTSPSQTTSSPGPDKTGAASRSGLSGLVVFTLALGWAVMLL